jgi:glucose/arabinose dehydrogenase
MMAGLFGSNRASPRINGDREHDCDARGEHCAPRKGELFCITIREIFAAPISTDGSIGTERRIASDLPDAGQHPNRTIAFGLDGFLYVSVGSTCNDCEENNPENATLLKMRPDGSGREIVAAGLRNTIGFAWEPRSGALYGLDNGVETYGDDEQPEELNRIEPGKTYGWPFILGAGMKHPVAGAQKRYP